MASVLVALSLALSGCGDRPQRVAPEPSHSQADVTLFSKRFPTMIVEVDYVEPHRPSQAALDLIRSDLQRYAGKTRVEFLGPDPIPPQGQYVSHKRLHDIHDATASLAKAYRFHDGRNALLHILYLEGEYEQPAMGLFLSSGVVTVFAKYLDRTFVADAATLENTGHGIHKEAMEKMVLRHELGHVYGLVNCGIAMVHPREDPDAPCHSTDRQSIMGGHSRPDLMEEPHRYLEWFQNGEPVSYTQDDLADIAAWKTRDPGLHDG